MYMPFFHLSNQDVRTQSNKSLEIGSQSLYFTDPTLLPPCYLGWERQTDTKYQKYGMSSDR